VASALALAVATPGQTPQLRIDGNPLPGVSSAASPFGRGPVDGTLALVFDDGVNGEFGPAVLLSPLAADRPKVLGC
jgi:hypothetical protein